MPRGAQRGIAFGAAVVLVSIALVASGGPAGAATCPPLGITEDPVYHIPYGTTQVKVTGAPAKLTIPY